MVSMLAFYFDDPSSNPAEPKVFSVKFVFEKKENKEKRGRGWPIFRVKCRTKINDSKLHSVTNRINALRL